MKLKPTATQNHARMAVCYCMLRLASWTFLALVLAVPISADELTVGPQRNYAIGTGFLISPDGLVLTSRPVVSKCVDLPEVGYVVSGRSKATVIALGQEIDLALLKTDFRGVPYLRLRAGGVQTALPVVGEMIFTLGIISGEFSATLGEVIQSDDPEQPLLSEAGSVLELYDGGGGAGAPVVDMTGLLIGIMWGKNPTDDTKFHILNNAALHAFLSMHGVPVPTEDLGPHLPRRAEGTAEMKKEIMLGHFTKIAGVLTKTTVKVACPID